MKFDQLVNRWVILGRGLHNDGAPGLDLACVAVSQGSDPKGPFNLYSFDMGLQQFNIGNYFLDYPKLAVWPDAHYISADVALNSLSGWVSGSLICALNSAAMQSGQTATQVCFYTGPFSGGVAPYYSLLPAELRGNTLPQPGETEFVMAQGIGSGALLWTFHVDFLNTANSTFTGPTTLATGGFTRACGGGSCIQQPETSQVLDSVGDRVLQPLVYRNFGDHESLAFSEGYSATGSTTGQTGIQWYELWNQLGTYSVHQNGQVTVNDNNYRWMPSISMDKAGDISVGYSESSGTVYPSLYYSARLASDPLNTMEPEALIISGTGSDTITPRWGSYFAMTDDPSDDCTFWFTGEYWPSGSNWATQLASWSFPSCTSAIAPHITVIGSSGITKGGFGSAITVTGTSFGNSQGTSTVSIGGALGTVTSWQAGTIVFNVPATAPIGNQYIIVNVGGVASNVALFIVLTTPSITSLTDANGNAVSSIYAGFLLYINGTGFETSSNGRLYIGGASVGYASWSPTQITVNVPVGLTIGVDALQVRNNDGAYSTPVNVTYLQSPSISVASTGPPSYKGSGPRGTAVILTGSNFGNLQCSPPTPCSTVTFTSGSTVITATPTSWSNTSITVPVPSNAPIAANSMVVTVNTVPSNPAQFVVTN